MTLHRHRPYIGSNGLQFAFELVLRGVVEEPIRSSSILDEAL